MTPQKFAVGQLVDFDTRIEPTPRTKGPYQVLRVLPADDEMKARIAHHRAQRDQGWTTIEEPLALVDALTREAIHGRAVLVDCLTLWLSNLMQAARDPEIEARRLTRFLGVARYPTILSF